MQVKMELVDLHTGRPLTQSNYTRCCINSIVLLKMNTELLETNIGFKYRYYRRNCASSWSPTRILRPIYRTGVPLPSRCSILFFFNKYKYWVL